MICRSDIIDEEHGKSITLERFVMAAEVLSLPTISDLKKALQLFKNSFEVAVMDDPDFAMIDTYERREMEILCRKWKESIPISEDPQTNLWSVSQVIWNRVESQTLEIMGQVGQLGLFVEESLFKLNTE